MDVTLPRLAEGVESGTVVSILVSEGQEIKKDQPFMELETQKAVGAIPAPQSGIVTKIHVKEGTEVSVGQVLISISTESGSVSAVGPARRPIKQEPSGAPMAQGKHDAASDGATRVQAQPSDETENYRYESKSGAEPPAAPSVRKIARQVGIDLTRVRGSARGGRIVLEDLRAYVERLQKAIFEEKTSAAKWSPTPSSEAVDFSRWGTVRREPMTNLRKTVSRRMLQSWTTVPKIDQFDDADITELLALRKKYASLYQKKDAHLTLTSFLLVAVVHALKQHPLANASIDEATGEIVYKDYYHVGIAVDTEAGLIVPVLRDVDKKSLLDLSRELPQLVEKTRQRKVSLDELQGGTFTISNQGSIGGSHFTPIIYPPQVAILGVGQAAPKPVVLENKLAIRTLLPLCLSYDHRLLDGANAVRFLKDLIQRLETVSADEVKLK